MNRTLRAITFHSKVILCLLLTLNLSIWTLGCGEAGAALFVGEQTVALTPDHSLTEALAGSDFEGATAVEVSPSSQRFRLIFPDGERQLSGNYIYVNGQAAVSSLDLTFGRESFTVNLNPDKQITDIISNQGATWRRPAEWNTQGPLVPGAPTAPQAPTAKASTGDLDAYMQANAQLLDLAAELDQQSDADDVNTLGEDAKAGQSSFAWAAAALISFIFVPLGIFASIVFVIQVVTLLNAIF